MKPSVSVIVPTFNRAHLVVRALNSIASQTEPPERLIVVDNNSTDFTLETVERWMKLYSGPIQITLLREGKPGAAAARDRGLAAADTEIVCFFDSDDEMRTSLIETVKREFDADPSLELLYWPVTFHPLSGAPRQLKFNPDAGIPFQIFHSFLGTQRFAATRELIIKAGGWDQDLPIWNDWELGIRLLLLEPVIKGYARALADIHAQKHSITGMSFHSRAENLELAIRHAESAVKRSRHPQKDRFLRLLNLRRAVLAGLYIRERHHHAGRRLLAEATEVSLSLTRPRRTAMLCRAAALHTAILRHGSSEWSRLI